MIGEVLVKNTQALFTPSNMAEMKTEEGRTAEVVPLEAANPGDKRSATDCLSATPAASVESAATLAGSRLI